MFSSLQNTLSNIPGPSRIASAVVSPIATMIEYQNFSSPHTVLQQCLSKLEHLEALLHGLSVKRRGKIDMAAQRGACKKLRDVEFELDRFFEEYRTLCRLYNESNFRGRFPGTLLHRHILDFEEDIMVFFHDVWNTTRPGDRAINWDILKMNTD